MVEDRETDKHIWICITREDARVVGYVVDLTRTY